MDIQEKNNKSIIKKLVKNHFSLDGNSLYRFNNAIDGRPPLVPMLEELFKDSEDMRLRFKLDTTTLADQDEAWKYFRYYFRFFVDSFNITYEDFLSNKKTVNKNKVKLKKLIEDFYIKNMLNENYCTHLMIDSIENKRLYLGVISTHKTGTLKATIEEQITKDLVYLEEGQAEKFIKELIVKQIQKNLEKVNSFKVKKDDLEVVVTRNFADFFMASQAGKNWKSCLSLNSDYEGAYWSGLPGTIVDPNRFMIYVTDGEKANYKGIEVDRYLQRSWMIVDENEVCRNLKWYEQKKISNEAISRTTGLKIAPNSGRDFKSFDSFEPLFFINDMSCFIYQDNSSFEIDQENPDSVYIVGDYESDIYYIERGRSQVEADCVFYYTEDSTLDEGLSTLMENDTNIADWGDFINENKYECDHCCERVNEENIHNVHGEQYCTYCYEETFQECEICGSVHYRDDMNYSDEGDFFCENCEDDFVYSEEKGWVREENFCRLRSDVGDYSNGFIKYEELFHSRAHDVMESNDYYFVKDKKMYYPIGLFEDENEYISSEDTWYSKFYLNKLNDKNQIKLDFESVPQEEPKNEYESAVDYFKGILKSAVARNEVWQTFRDGGSFQDPTGFDRMM